MDFSGVRLSTVAAISTGAILTGSIAYAIYFDHKRRNDPEFRKALKREAKQAAKADKEKHVEQEKQRRAEVLRAVQQANEEPYPDAGNDVNMEAFVMDNLALGEHNAKQGNTLEAALHFYKVLKIYPQKMQLLNMLDREMPKDVCETLAIMLANDDLEPEPVS